MTDIYINTKPRFEIFLDGAVFGIGSCIGVCVFIAAVKLLDLVF